MSFQIQMLPFSRKSKEEKSNKIAQKLMEKEQIRHQRMLFWALVLLYPLWSMMEYIIIPEKFTLFLVIRLLTVGCLLLSWLIWDSRLFSQKIHLHLWFFIPSLQIIWVIKEAPVDHVLPYFMGFAAFFIAFNLLALWKLSDALIQLALCLLGIAFSGLLWFPDAISSYLENGGLFFISLASVASLVAGLKYQNLQEYYLFKATQMREYLDLQKDKTELSEQLKMDEIRLKSMKIHNQTLKKKISEQQKMRQGLSTMLKESHREFDTYLYKSAHDLRGPIARMMGLMTLTKLENKTFCESEYLSILEKEIFSMDHQLKKLLVINVLYNHKVQLQGEQVSKLWKEAWMDHPKAHTIPKGCYMFEAHGEDLFMMDRVLMKIIFEQIISNSIGHYSQNPSKSLKIKVTWNGQQISIRDNGPGMPEEFIPQAFDMFSRMGSQQQGTGLGLYIVKKAAHLQNIEVKLKSETGRYTSIILIPQQEKNDAVLNLKDNGVQVTQLWDDF